MSIKKHEHQWVPWNAHRLTVCDDTTCHAGIRWDQAGIIDYRKVVDGSVTEPPIRDPEFRQLVDDVRVIHGDEAARMVRDGWTVDGALAHLDQTCDITVCTHPDHRLTD